MTAQRPEYLTVEFDMTSDPGKRTLILASSSPRRRDLLAAAGYEFVVVTPDVEELARPDESPESLSQRLALEKALDVAARSDPGDCVLAADTIVVLGARIFGKPRDAEHAEQMLGRRTVCADPGARRRHHLQRR